MGSQITICKSINKKDKEIISLKNGVLHKPSITLPHNLTLKQISDSINESQDSPLIYYGSFKNNLRHGLGCLVLKNNTRIEGEFCDGFINKTGAIYFPSGDIYYGEISKSYQMEGLGKILYHNGEKYQGNFKDGLKEGFGCFTFLSGEQVSGAFSNDFFLQ
jgi:hypothetical protein